MTLDVDYIFISSGIHQLDEGITSGIELLTQLLCLIIVNHAAVVLMDHLVIRKKTKIRASDLCT